MVQHLRLTWGYLGQVAPSLVRDLQQRTGTFFQHRSPYLMNDSPPKFHRPLGCQLHSEGEYLWNCHLSVGCVVLCLNNLLLSFWYSWTSAVGHQYTDKSASGYFDLDVFAN